MSDYKPGSIATAPNGNKWVRSDNDGLWFTDPPSGNSPLDDGLVIALGLTVTPPPQVPVVAEFHVPDGKYLGKDLPENFKGKDCVAVLKEAVLDTIENVHPDSNLGQYIIGYTNRMVIGKSYKLLIVIEEPKP